MFRHGYQKANDDSKEWPVLEVKRNEDPNEDPWERMRDAKRKRTDKNLQSRMRNEEKAGSLPKGTTTRVMKSRDKVRKAGKLGGNMDRDNVVPVGVPVDLKPRKGGDKLTPLKRGKVSTMAALTAAQQSTASLGKFDKMREGEPERKKPRLSSNKKKLDGATDKKVLASEREKGMKVLNTVLNGGAAREKARKKGAFAKGETAYDYDYNDGLGASSFKKKKVS
jgi:regulator of ribosome biosynthesis